MARRNRRFWRKYKLIRKRHDEEAARSAKPEQAPVGDVGGSSWTDGARGGTALFQVPSEAKADARLVRRFGLRDSLPLERASGLHKQMAHIVEQHTDASIRIDAYEALQRTQRDDDSFRLKQQELEVKKLIAGNRFSDAPLPIGSADSPDKPDDGNTVDAESVVDADKEKRKAELLKLMMAMAKRQQPNESDDADL